MSDMHEPSDGEAIDSEVASFVDAQRRVDEALTSGEAFADEAEHKLASLTGTPEGVGPRVRPDCPICTGGRGLPCAWHALS